MLENLRSSGAETLRVIPSELYDRSTFDGPLSSILWRKAHSVPSKYEDTFDYAVYDDLLKRFPPGTARGGVIFKSAIKLVNYHSSCRQCHYSFEIDTYGRGCTFNCTYCYAKERLTRYGYWNEPVPMPLDIADVRKIFSTVFESEKNNTWREILEKRIPLRIGSMSDAFMWMDKRIGVTKELLKILNFYNYPYIVFTRSDMVADDEYLPLIKPELASIQVSLSSINDTLIRKIESGAPSARRRLKALRTLNQAGIWTTVRINPLFPMYPDGYYSDPTFVKSDSQHLDFFSWDLIEAVADCGVPSLLAGVVRLNPVALKRFSSAAGVDYSKFFKRDSLKKNGDKRFSDAEVAYYYQEIRRRAHKRGVRFNSCYIGNGEKDYFQYQNLWDNKKDCCDARGNVPAFKKSCQEIPDACRVKHAPASALPKATPMAPEYKTHATT